MSKSKKQKTGICALCKGQKHLRNSHIVPEFFYKSMYEGNGPRKFLRLPPCPTQRILKYQKGLREYLFCDECEARFNIYETYAAGVFNSDKAGTPKINGNAFIFRGLDYSKLKNSFFYQYYGAFLLQPYLNLPACILTITKKSYVR